VALIWTALLIIYEIGSILENAHEFGLKVTWLQKWLRVFERDVGKTPDKDDQENNVR
jgi:polar amino acid transport system substrate-binding protein